MIICDVNRVLAQANINLILPCIISVYKSSYPKQAFLLGVLWGYSLFSPFSVVIVMRWGEFTALWMCSTLWNPCTIEQIKDKQTLPRQNILSSAFLDYKLIEYINILKERMCQSEKDESGYGSIEKSHFANFSSIYLSSVQNREFWFAASSLVAIKTPSTRTSSSCSEAQQTNCVFEDNNKSRSQKY